MTVVPDKRSAPRVAFGLLVESGIVAPGTRLTDAKAPLDAPRSAPTARSPMAMHIGSIHKVGAALQGAPSCNGWTFWHVERDGALAAARCARQAYLASRSIATGCFVARSRNDGRCIRTLIRPTALRRFAVRP